MNMSQEELIVTYKWAMNVEKKKYEHEGNMTRNWAKKIDTLFNNLYIFTNPKMWKHIEEQKDKEEMQEDIPEENFLEYFDHLLYDVGIPDTMYIVQEDGDDDPYQGMVPAASEEKEERMTSFRTFKSRQLEKGGTDDGDGPASP